MQSQQCNTQPCQSSRWSEWSELDKCSATCSGGRQTKYRYCIGGEPGSDGCQGLTQEALECNTQKCVGDELCPDSLFDVAILIEANAKTAPHQTEIKNFLSDLFKSYKSVSPGDVRLCLMRFSSWSEILHPFSSLKDINAALAAVGEIGFYGKGADLDQAVSSIEQMCFDKSMGWRGTSINERGVSSQARFQVLRLHHSN